MIGKSIRMNRRQRRAVARRMERVRKSIFALTRYVVDADPYSLIAGAADEILSISDYMVAASNAGIEPGEKVEAFGTRNLAGRDLGEWQAEMLAVAARATEVRSPLLHIILSLHADETWTEAQREEAITIVLEVLGLQRCQVIWAEHSNTSHPHLHLSVLRIDPVTARATGTRWVIDDLHQAIAIIEERQDRVREPHALYVARKGAVFDVETGAMVRDADGTYMPEWYKEAGKKRTWLPVELVRSRAALVHAAATSQSWSELHDAFRELDASYDKASSGARIRIGKATATASEVHSSLSRPTLEKHLGPFQGDIHRVDHEYEAYREAFQKQLDYLRKKRNDEQAGVDLWVTARLAEMPSGTTKLLSRAVQEEAEAAKKALQKAFADAIKRCTDQRLTKEKWVTAGRPKTPKKATVPAAIFPSESGREEAGWQPALGFERHETRSATEYRDHDGLTVFADHRSVIIVHATKNALAIDAALRIAQERWGVVRLTGPADFIELASKRASELGIKIHGPAADEFNVPERVLYRNDDGKSEVAQPKNAHRANEAAPGSFRGQRVDEAIRYFARWRYLRIRRREMPGDDSMTGRTGPFELVVADSADRAWEDYAIYEKDKRVQDFLAEKHAQLMRECEDQLFERAPMHLPDDERRILQYISGNGPTRLLAQVASGDSEFVQMLQRVQLKLLQRGPKVRQTNLGITNTPASQVSTADEYAEAMDRKREMERRNGGRGWD